jgi:hypothetical protein
MDFASRVMEAFIKGFYLRSPILQPLTDLDVQWSSAEEGRAVLRLLASGRKGLFTHVPPPLAIWEEMDSDDQTARWAFAGIAAHTLEPVLGKDSDGAVYFSDFTWMKGLEVRTGFEHYGAAAYFNEDQELLKVEYSHINRMVYPSDGDLWKRAKFVWRSSAMVGITLRDHLTGLHLTFADEVTTSAVENLPQNHPLRRFLKPFLYRTIQINFAASNLLCAEYSLLHRTVALTWPALRSGFEYSFDIDYLRSKWSSRPTKDGIWARYFENTPKAAFKAPLPEELARKGKYPYYEDLQAYYKVVEKFVGSFLNIYSDPQNQQTGSMRPYLHEDPDVSRFWEHIHQGAKMSHITHKGWGELNRDKLSEMLTLFIVAVTGMHQHLGNVAEYLVDPTFLTPAIRPGGSMNDVQKSVQGMAIAVSTGFVMPSILDDFTHLLLHDEHYEAVLKVYEQFNQDLRRLSHEIDERNKVRKWPCNAFNPRFLTTSVSV